jgi:zinc transport system substrate-binding protein
MKSIFLLSFFLINLISVAKENLKVITTIVPNSILIEKVLQNRGETLLLVPAGTDIHHFEPTAKNIIFLNDGDIFFYTNDSSEPWVKKISSQLPKKLVIKKLAEEKISHAWLDPVEADRMLLQIEKILNSVSPENTEYFSMNRIAFSKEIQNLHQQYKETLAPYTGKSIVYIGHKSFEALAKRYNINFLTPYKTTSTDAEPTPQDIIKVIKYIRENHIQYIFFEEGESPKMINLIAENTGAIPLALNPIHMIKGDYIEIMQENLNKIMRGLKNESNSN